MCAGRAGSGGRCDRRQGPMAVSRETDNPLPTYHLKPLTQQLDPQVFISQVFIKSKMISLKENDIIDLTADMSDLGFPSGTRVSSAIGRPSHRKHPKPRSTSSRQEHKHRPIMSGRSFAVQGKDKYYRSVRFKGMNIEVSTYERRGYPADVRLTR